MHSFYYSPIDTAYEYETHFAALLDGLLIPQIFTGGDRLHVKNFWDNIFDPAKTSRDSETFQLISIGYPRVAAMYEKIKKLPQGKGNLLYAPLMIIMLLNRTATGFVPMA